VVKIKKIFSDEQAASKLKAKANRAVKHTLQFLAQVYY
jgi:hypothetical protein